MKVEALPRFDPISLPPGTRQCGGRAFSLIDYTFFFFELISGVGAIITGASDNYEECGACLAAFACFGVGHCLVRKYGSVAKIVNRFNQAQRNYQTTIGLQQGQIGQLGEHVQVLTDQNTALFTEQNRFSEENKQFAGQLEEQKKTLDVLRGTNAKLEEINKQLSDKVANLETINDSLQARIHDFAKQNHAFYEEIKQAASAIPSLKKSAESVQKGGIETAASAKDLEREVKETHLLIHQIVDGLKKNQEDLSVQLNALESEKDKLHEETMQLQEERNRFQQASEAAARTIEQLQKTQTSLEQRIADLSHSSHGLGDQVHQLTDLVHDVHRNTGPGFESAANALRNADEHLAHEEDLEAQQDAVIDRDLGDETQ